MTKEELLKKISDILANRHHITLDKASDFQKYDAVVRIIKEELLERQRMTQETYFKRGVRQLYYLSIEFLIGRLLGANLLNMGETQVWRELLQDIGLDLNTLENAEPDAGTGNGGLGRLVACFLDSLATLSYPGHGYGIRYKHGLFNQRISKGEQVEVVDRWLQEGYPWESRRDDLSVLIRFGGTVETQKKGDRLYYTHHEDQLVKAVPYDVPVVGYGNMTVNTLRLWGAEAPGDSQGEAVTNEAQSSSTMGIEAITEQLYPDDSHYEGRVLRLKQQYFMVSASIQSIVRDYKVHYSDITRMDERVAIHINDTHPALAIPELMRILMDEEGLGWDQAWRMVVNMMAYTNHTILPEALEKWPVETMRSLLPRVYQIISEINERYCKNLWGFFPYQWQRISDMAIISNEQVFMAHLSIAGCHSVNGVAALHTEILEKETLKNFYNLAPHKFNNKTNGITHRRWLMLSNPQLADFISEVIGSEHWIRDPESFRILTAYRRDSAVLEKLQEIKYANKKRLADFIFKTQGVVIDPSSRFDIQVKRIHLYKRQLLNALHLLYRYRQLKENPNLEIDPVTFIFGGKAAPGYYLAKRVIKLINDIAVMINNDPVCKGKLKAVFIENFNVTKGEYVYPAADVSEQISLASKEASGTGNMKFMMNGAVTLGTWDGANVEIGQRVGLNNIVVFGMRADEVIRREQDGSNRPWEMYDNDPEIKALLDCLVDGFIDCRQGSYQAVFNELKHRDTFMVLRDFYSYADAHAKIQGLYRDQRHWGKMCLLNIANSGFFSSDRTIRQYAEDIWLLDPTIV